MLRVIIAVLVGALGVGVSASTVAIADAEVDVAGAVAATRAEGPTIGLDVHAERQVGAEVVARSYGDGVASSDGTAGRWDLRVEDRGTTSPADVGLDGSTWSVRSPLLDDVLAPEAHGLVDDARRPSSPGAALALGLVGDLPVGLDLLDLAEAPGGTWRRDVDETLADGTPVRGWRRDLAPDELLDAFSPAQARRWRLQLLAVTPDREPSDAGLPTTTRALEAVGGVLADPPGRAELRVHVDDEGLARRVELVVRGDGGGRFLQRRHVLEVRDHGRRVAGPEADAVVTDLTGSSGA